MLNYNILGNTVLSVKLFILTTDDIELTSNYNVFYDISFITLLIV
jgi:hypothetical protein